MINTDLVDTNKAIQKRSYSVQFHLNKIYEVGKSTETEGRLSVARGWVKWGVESKCSVGARVSSGVMRMFWN